MWEMSYVCFQPQLELALALVLQKELHSLVEYVSRLCK